MHERHTSQRRLSGYYAMSRSSKGKVAVLPTAVAPRVSARQSIIAGKKNMVECIHQRRDAYGNLKKKTPA